MFWQRCSWVLLLAGLTHLPGFAQPDPAPPSPAEGAEEATAEEAQQKAAELLAFLEQSQQRLEIEAEERLLALIEAIPPRWSRLPVPKVPYSGRGPNQVLAEAQRDEKDSAAGAFQLYAKLPLEMRAAVSEKLLAENEVAIWVPGALAQAVQTTSPAKQAVLLEAWLIWLEFTGRQDALLFAASSSLDLLLRRRGVASLEKCAATWALLPVAERAEAGSAAFNRSQADILFRLGKNQEALDAHRKARSLFEATGEQIGQGYSWKGEADILFRLGKNQEALNAYRKARSLFEATGEQIGQGNSWKGEAVILFRLGKNQEALNAYRKARSLFEATGEQIGQGNSWRGEADILFLLGKIPEALDAYRKARALFEATGDQLGQGNSWRGEARVQLKLRAFAEAAAAARRAIGIWDGLREGFLDETARLRLHNSMAGAYDILVPAFADLGSKPEFVVAAEEAKSRVLLDLIAGAFPVRAQEAEPFDFAQKKLELQTELAEIRKGADEEGSLDQQRVSYDRQLEQLAFESLLESPTALLDARPLTFDQLSALSEEIGPVLGFYVADAETFGYLLLPKKPPVLFRAPHSWGHWLEKAPEVVDHLANENYRNAAERDVRELWDQLFLPLAASLPESGTLVVVPHGPLHQLPFETLTDAEGRRLFERFELSVVPSLATLAELRKRHQPADQQDRLLALAAGRGLTLPENEIKAIGQLFNPKEAAGFSAKLANFSTYEKLVPRTRHLLVASHGIHVEGNLRQTYLEIEPSTNHDHRLSAAEIATIPIEAELVALAACDTAVGKADFSDERLDLSRAFLVAGAAAVLATRWRLPDDPRTTQFLVDFYSAYRGVDGQKGKRKAEALNIARRLAIERGDPSAFWAAWVLIGDPR